MPFLHYLSLHGIVREKSNALEIDGNLRHQNRHDRIRGPRRYYEQGNEVQQGDDEESYLRRTADEMKGDGKLGLKRLDDQWPQTSWRDHGSVYVSPIAGQP